MATSTILIMLGIILQIIAVIFLASKSKKRIQQNTVTITTNDPEELQQFLKEHSVSEKMLEHFKKEATNFTSTQTIRTVKCVNGKVISDEIQTITNDVPANNYCPHCGTKVENSNENTCRYCNKPFNN